MGIKLHEVGWLFLECDKGQLPLAVDGLMVMQQILDYQQLAEKSQMTYSNLRHMLKGKSGHRYLRNYWQIALALEVTLDDIRQILVTKLTSKYTSGILQTIEIDSKIISNKGRRTRKTARKPVKAAHRPSLMLPELQAS